MRGFTAIPLLVLLSLLASSCPAATICVSPSAPGPTHDGASWATAYASVTAALSAASPGDEVWVSAGTYKENITLPSGVALYGGFTGTETSREQRDPVKNVTVLDGQDNGKSAITIPADATSQTVLDGFTVQNGIADRNVTLDGHVISEGGGILVWGGTPVITSNLIHACGAMESYTYGSFGGGMYVDGGMPLIQGNTFDWNGAWRGGGLYAIGGLIRDNIFTGCVAGDYDIDGYGAGMYIETAAVAVHNTFTGNKTYTSYGGGAGAACYGGTLIGNVFRDNLAVHYGSALWCAGNSTVLRNTFTNTISRYGSEVIWVGGVFSGNLIATESFNPALDLGGGPGNADGTEPVITNNTIVGRQTIYPSSGQYGIMSEYNHGEKPILANNIITGFWLAVWYGNPVNPPFYTADHNDCYGNTENALNVPGASPIGENGNISSDPLFVNPSGWDYHLKEGSPCIDAGNDAVVKPQDRDVEGRPRIAGAHVDIGAYEVGSPSYTVQDAATVLRIAAGISLSTPADLSRLDVAGETGLTVTDATRIAQWLLG